MKSSPILPWCPAEKSRLTYEGRVRSGRPGQLTSEEYEVWEMEQVRLAFLQPFPEIDYTDSAYRISVNDSDAIEQYFALHAAQQPGYLALIEKLLTPGVTVADCGCGGGALLDLVKTKTAGPTIAIEPFGGYARSLGDRGHLVFNDVPDAVSSGVVADVALSVHVIEHVADPVAYLADLRRLTKPGGHAVVLTPNLDDILMKIDPNRMEPFFYRRVHNYYFSVEALRWVAVQAGWTVGEEVFYHEFGLSNALLWLRDGIPAEQVRLDAINDDADRFWKSYLETTKQSNNVGVILNNPE